MAAAATYILKTVTFKSTAVDGLEDVQVGEEGTSVSHSHDGLSTITATFLDDIKGTVRVSSRNSSWFVNANYQIGSAGSLVIVWQQRAVGKGAAAGVDKTITASNAVVVRTSADTKHSDRGTFEVEFECADPAGTNPFAFS